MNKTPIAGEYDYGKKSASKTQSFKIKSYDFKSQSDMKIRATSGYADNAMEDPSAINEDAGDDMLVTLHDMLHKAGVSQSEIQNGVTLTPRGLQKVAARLGIGAEEVKVLLNSLRSTHKDGIERVEESTERYGYEADVLGTISINDNETGKSKVITGAEGANLLGRLEMVEKGSDVEQSILADCMGLMETVEFPEPEAEKADFRKEIANSAGTFNFPWVMSNAHGTATAAYSGDGADFKLRVIDVREHDGARIEIKSPRTYQEILRQARDFIGQE